MEASMFYGTYLGGRLVFYHDVNGGGSVGAARDGGGLVPFLAEPAEGWHAGSGNASASALPTPTPRSTVAESPVPQAYATTDTSTAPSTANSALASTATPTDPNPNLRTRTTNQSPAPPLTTSSNPTYQTHSHTINIPSSNTSSSQATFDASGRLTYNIIIPDPLPPSVINPDSAGQAPPHNYTRRYNMRHDGIRAMTEIFGNAGRLARFRTDIMPAAPPITFGNIEAATDANSTAVAIADDIPRTFPTHYVPESTTTSSQSSAPRPPFSTNRAQATPTRSTPPSAGPSIKSSITPKNRQLNPFVVHLCMLRTFGVPWRAIIRCNSTWKANQLTLIQYYYLVKRTRQPEWVCGSSRLGIDSFHKVLGRMPFSSPPLRYNQVRFICLVRFGLKFDWTWTMKYFRKTFPEDAACLATKDNDYLMVRVVMRLANERSRVEAIFDGVGGWLSGDAEVPPEVFGWLAEFGEGRTVEMMRKEIMGGL
ncbi:MAG: hypothetical protein M1840_007347 [Geoglossum simile]|nr:MAG: hypothetical protein M1840_007347 [Geoglossum simile]